MCQNNANPSGSAAAGRKRFFVWPGILLALAAVIGISHSLYTEKPPPASASENSSYFSFAAATAPIPGQSSMIHITLLPSETNGIPVLTAPEASAQSEESMLSEETTPSEQTILSEQTTISEQAEHPAETSLSEKTSTSEETEKAETQPSLPEPPSEPHTHTWQPVYGTVRHEALSHLVHHDAEIETIRHDAVVRLVHHEAETRTVHHEAETHIVMTEEIGHWEYYERHSFCNACGLDLTAEYFEGRLSEIGLHSLDIHDGAAGWHSEWVSVESLHPDVTEDACREEWIVDEPAREETVLDREAWDELITDREAWDESITDQEAWEETVTVKEAWDELIIDREAWDETVILQYRCACGAVSEP